MATELRKAAESGDKEVWDILIRWEKLGDIYSLGEGVKQDC